jgi:hypothetical protein
MPTGSPRPFKFAIALLAAVLAIAVIVAWVVRFRVATAFVNRELAAAGVDASYRITSLTPFLARMEAVRIGDPGAPDLLARQIDVAIGYGLGGPRLGRITLDGVRLRGRYDAQGLHLGAIDRLLPKSGGKAGLPDMPLSIRDTSIALATPNGAISATVKGEGNPARRFGGEARVVALALQANGCTARDITAMLTLSSTDETLKASGPVRTSGLACPHQEVALGPAAAQVALASHPGFRRLELDANLVGGAGRVQTVDYASLRGTVSGSWSATGYGALVYADLKSARAPAYAKAVMRTKPAAAGTPIAPLADRAISAAAALLSRADVSADVRIAGGAGRPMELRLRQIDLEGEGGARLALTERGGLSWSDAGLRIDGDLKSFGGGLPDLAVRIRQAAPGAPLTGLAAMRPYRSGAAQIAATPIHLHWDGRRGTFATVVTLDGPVAGGSVRGLAVPLKGHADAGGAFVIGAGCQTIAFERLQLSSFTFAAGRIPVCGRSIVARTAAGDLRVDAATGPIRLAGRTSDGAPVTLAAGGLRLTQAGFSARDLTTTLGGPGRTTRLSVASFDGTNGRTIGGNFSGASGGIGNVPLAMDDASGSWTLDRGALRLSGMLTVRDADAAARFNPLWTDNTILALRDGIIEAAATLREPATGSAVVAIDLRHDLARGSGHAVLDVPGITFVPKGLQPERLTPLTLGVIANVAGTIAGEGRIDWGPDRLTSTGDFRTDGIDLAAAFGPVQGIRGTLHFTDLLGLVSASDQQATVAEINPGVAVTNGLVRYRLLGGNRVQVDGAQWPFAGGSLQLDPTILDFAGEAQRQLTFRISGLDAAGFVQQLDFPNISATGTFDGLLPMVFDQKGGRIAGGSIVARQGGGTIAYVGELSNAQLGTMGKLAFDALKAIRYSALDISLDGRLDGEMVSQVRFTGVREATPDQSLTTRLIRNLPFRFNISVRAPFRGLVGSARAYIDPRLLLSQAQPAPPAGTAIQPPASGDVR